MTKVPLDFIIERMKLYDPTEIIDLLDISSEDLIDKFYDRIVEKKDYLSGEFELFVDTDNDELDLDNDWGFHDEDGSNDED